MHLAQIDKGIGLKALIRKIAGLFDGMERLIRRFRAILLVVFALMLLGALTEIKKGIYYIPETDTSGLESTLESTNSSLKDIDRSLKDIDSTLTYR